MKDLVIKLKLDKAMADAAARSHVEQLRHIKSAHESNAAAQKKATKEYLDDQKKANKEALDDARAAEKAKLDAKKSFATAAKQTDRELVEAERRANKEAAEASRITAKIKADSAKMAQKAAEQGFTSQSAGLQGVAIAVGAVATGYGVLATAAQAGMAIGEMWKNQRRDIEDSVDRVTQYRDAILELAALKDRLGQSTPELQSQLEFRAKTLQTKGAAASFQQGALNVGQSAMASGLVAEPEFAKLMQLMGSYQAATNGDPKAMGELTGAMPSLIGGQNQSAGDIFRRTIGIAKIFEKGGSDPGVAFSQFTGNSAYTKLGVFKSPEQQAALQSQLSLSHSGDPGTKLDQLVRGTVGAFGRTRVGKLDGSESQRDYLLGLGATPDMDPIAITRLIAADIQKQQAADPKFAPLDYLVQKGYMDEQARMAIMETSSGINTGQFDATFGKMAAGQAIPTLDAAMTPINRFQAVDPAARPRKESVAADLSDAIKATGPEAMYLHLRKIAFDRLVADKKTYGKFEDQNNSTIYGGQITDEVQRMLKESGDKVGVKDTTGSNFNSNPVNRFFGVGRGEGILGGSLESRAFYSEASRANAFAEFAQRIQEKGGKIDGLDQLVDLARQQLELQKKMEDRAAKGIPGMANPAVPPVLRAAPIVQNR